MRYLTNKGGLLLGAIAFTIACGDTIVNVPTTPSPTTPTPITKTHAIQFRVTGNPTSVRIRYSTPIDGLGQVITSLPYFQGFSITGDSLFLSLEGAPIQYGFATTYPFLSVQIVVDGSVFREATSQDFLLNSALAVSGQWRQ